jgi:hypothetical protein
LEHRGQRDKTNFSVTKRMQVLKSVSNPFADIDVNVA